MSLKLDNVQALEVKNVTDYKIKSIVIDADSGNITLVYDELSNSDLITTSTIVVNNPTVFANLKTQAYNFLINNLGVTGTVN